MSQSGFDSGLSHADLERVRDLFGVAEPQVLRDHLISLLLAAISRSSVADAVVFFGGTALCRTLLPDHRLSEDIDLMVRIGHDRKAVAHELQSILTRATARTHGTLHWSRALSESPEHAFASTDEGITVQVQLLRADDYPRLPTVDRDLDQHYSDVPPARLAVLTQESFVVAKTTAWLERNTPRDLYDLWALTNAGYLGREAVDLYRRFGPTGRTPALREFPAAPSESDWTQALAHQCRVRTCAEEAFRVVTEAWLDSGKPIE